MDSNYRPYNHIGSYGRIDSILDAPPGAFEEVDSLPDRDRLTFTNGFYAYCTALFVDLRDSSSLPTSYQRPQLAKIYRAFISEMVAVLNSDPYTREVNIVGDCVWAVYNTPRKTDIDDIFEIAARVNSLMQVLNYKLRKKGFATPIKAGTGIAYGRALMIKAGYSGSGINDVVYMGDVVNSAAKLASRANTGGWPVRPIHMESTFHQNLSAENQQMTTKLGWESIYTADVYNTEMHTWYQANCK